jgi:SAM-dependent methyltransferase
MDPDQDARRFAAAALAQDDPTGWFDRLYKAADEGDAIVPWDRDAPHSMLVEWAEVQRLDGRGRRAMVVGCGTGRDSEYLASLGFATTAFDVSETAVDMARRRHPGTPVDYVRADLLDPPQDWLGAFDLVVESMTVQSLPPAHHRAAIDRVGPMVAPGGSLLVIAAARDADEPADGPPWPLTRDEIDAFAAGAPGPVAIEDVSDDQEPFVRRWRAVFAR